ncbi:MAG: DMT family transporter [Clostridia bacterium]|nr:DMT family transporter [Clostridia bacterium]
MWYLYAIATALIWGLAELFYKKGARPDEKYSHLKICVCVGLIMGIHAVYVLLTEDINYNFINIIKYFPVSFLYILSMALSFFGMRFLEESISDPIENTSGAIASILCFLVLKQSMSLFSLFGVALIIIGVVVIGITESKDENGRIKKLGKKLAIIAFIMPFLYAILDGTASFMDAYFLEAEISPLVNVTEDTIELVANTSYELTFTICAIILMIYIKIKNEKVNIIYQKDKILAAIFETLGQFTYVFAMGGSAIIAAPIISSVCIFSLIFSRIFLKEKLTKRQYIAVFTVILGIMILCISEEI